MAGPRALLVLAAAVAAASCSLLAAPAAADVAALASVCQMTKFPELCTTTAGLQAGKYPTVDVLTVLRMQVDALDKQTAAARARVAELAKTATPAGRAALELCGKFYFDVEDNLGACRRAIGFKDAETIRATMLMAVQDMQNCDQEFRNINEPNPMQGDDASLSNLVENCRYLSNHVKSEVPQTDS
ncbi:hypothetical protein ACP70R_031350 [Stipagrostis hirtigluma subsp. patula]